jgi:hypothetical protein
MPNNNLKQLSLDYLNGLEPSYLTKGYSVPKWIKFCKEMLNTGWKVKLYRSKSTFSKYIHISKGETNLKIRFSNHKANINQEQKGDSDYYVGVGNNGVITTEQLIEKIEKEYESIFR